MASAAAPMDLTREEKANILHIFVDSFPESNLAYEMKGRPEIRKKEKMYGTENESNVLHNLLGLDGQNNLSTVSMVSLISVEEDLVSYLLKSFLRRSFSSDNFTMIDNEIMKFVGPLEENLHLYFEVNVNVSEHESFNICTETVNQSTSSKWKEERARRITASRAYFLYTYYKTQPEKVKDWKRKIMSMVIPRHVSTPAIEHGLRCEKQAVAAYERDFGKDVLRCGFVIPPHIPWLGCSPDGIIVDEEKVIEIKCPEAGKHKCLNDFIGELPYLTKLSSLRKSHAYYAQVQLNIFILKCKSADFLIYSAYEDKCYVQEIKFDAEYVRSLMAVLKEVYFNVFLKYLYYATFEG
ncbi:uncharacterized protein LOC129721006 [Wyeomyia smithii]|uniref:uncharacterized protein LOC129721006 n=1 Tax=Wyeomyia smithii TaxID=174621 RepID=UPI002467B293|nr:uncharacterized protein LOC129721006 [Wyeomyia smithii]XP_055529002.1 uncharacterized protein LOC129721006 [Wyeomyia smithii]